MNYDHLSDMVTRIRNGYLSHKREVVLPHTNFLASVADVMVQEKYLQSVTVKKDGIRQNLHLTLLYANGHPALTHVQRVSKPGVRIYSGAKAIKPVLSGMGIALLSTSQGVMTDRSAKKLAIGGEVLFELW